MGWGFFGWLVGLVFLELFGVFLASLFSSENRGYAVVLSLALSPFPPGQPCSVTLDPVSQLQPNLTEGIWARRY